MSSGVEGGSEVDTETMPAPDDKSDQEPAAKPQHHHHVLIEPDEDRWAWRRKIRQNPRKLAIYRVAVGVAGLLMVCLGIVTGPLPGPGGIPLVLLGLAIWSSEFEWAHKIMESLKARLKRYRGWSRRRKLAFWAVFFGICGTLGYSSLLLFGVPSWLPAAARNLLQQLPGV